MVLGTDLESGKNEKHPLLSGKGISASGSCSGNSRRDRRPRGDALFAILCTMAVAFGPIAFGFSMGYSSPTQQGMTRDLKLSLSQFSMYGSLVNLGAMLGAVVSGRIADRLGRKGALVTASIPHIIGWFANAFTKDVVILYLGRLLVGFGVGIISFTVPMYIAEIAPKQLRGSLGTVNQLSVTIGIFLSYLGGLFLDWRSLAVVGVIPCTILLIGLLFIPESPRWLAKAGIEDSLITSLQALRGKDCDISSELADIKDSVEMSYKQEANVRISDLCKRNLFRPLIIGIGLQVLQQLGGINAILFYSSFIFRSAGFASSNLASFFLSALQVAMTAVAVGFMDKAGRRLLLMLSAGGMAASSFLVGCSFYLQDHVDPTSQLGTFISNLALISLLVFVSSFSLGMGPIPWIVMSEVFPAHIKGLAGSVATLVNWSCAWLVTMTFNFLLTWSSTGSFLLFAGECAVTVVFVALLVPETRGRTLEEIQALFD